jgi:Tfp pilus assembly protein PilF
MIPRLTSGTYELTIDAGAEYEVVNESVQFIGGDARNRGEGRSFPGQTTFVQITLRLKAADIKVPGVVNAALAGIPQPAIDLYQQALSSAQSGNHKKAIEQLKKALALAPQFVSALNELGMQYMQLNELELAADSLQKAMKRAPDAFLLRLNYGLVLLQQKKFREAESELRLALAKSDTSALAHEYRARALIGLRQLDDAEKELRRALDLGGDLAANAHRYLAAIYMQRGEDDRAIIELEEYLRLQPTVRDADQIRQIIKELRKRQ